VLIVNTAYKTSRGNFRQKKPRWALEQCAAVKLQAKKTPVGDRGVRVIVVVANSVSATAPDGGGFLLLYKDFLVVVFYSSY